MTEIRQKSIDKMLLQAQQHVLKILICSHSENVSPIQFKTQLSEVVTFHSSMFWIKNFLLVFFFCLCEYRPVMDIRVKYWSINLM